MFEKKKKKKKEEKEEERKNRNSFGGHYSEKTNSWFFMTHFKMYSILVQAFTIVQDDHNSLLTALPALPLLNHSILHNPKWILSLKRPSSHSSQDKVQNLQHGYQGHLKFSSNL